MRSLVGNGRQGLNRAFLRANHDHHLIFCYVEHNRYIEAQAD